MKVGVLATTFAALLVAIPLAAMAGPAPDMDNDTVPDVIDNCKMLSNGPPKDCDTDMDGYGNLCDCDFDNNATHDCGGPDFGAFGMAFGGPETAAGEDMTCDGLVGGPDFGAFGMGFGGKAGPSGLSCAGTVACP